MFNHLLTDELKSKGRITMTTEYAWKYRDVIEVISYLSSKECAILGGDVLNNNLGYTHDNWYYSYSDVLSIENNICESASRAVEYVDWYYSMYGDDFYYIIVAAKKADYLLMQDSASN